MVLPSAVVLSWPRPAGLTDTKSALVGHAVYTGWVSVAGLPALAVPCEPSQEGLPIGMQLIGRFGADDTLLPLGEAHEAAHP